MISSSSLSAFSASVLEVGLSPIQGPLPIRPFGFGQSGAQQAPAQIVPDPSKQMSPQGPAPRGSLLDISV